METKIKAIPTRYNGYRFRSRIEARWAVFFDCCKIEYEYEKEGFDLDGTFYLPDFFLPKLDCFVEIKGEGCSVDDEKKMKLLCKNTKKRVYLLSGDMPYADDEDSFFDLMYKKQFHSFTMYFPNPTNDIEIGSDSPYVFCECPDCGMVGIEFDGRSDRLPCKGNTKLNDTGLGIPNGYIGKIVCKKTEDDKCPTHSPNCDKGYNWLSYKIRCAYETARSYQFEK